MFSRQYDWAWHESLGFRILAMLSLVLLPIGLLAVVQTAEVTKRAETQAKVALAAQTGRVAATQRETIHEVLGAAEAIGVVIKRLRDDPSECIEYLESLIDVNPIYSFIGFIPEDGLMSCTSNGETVDATRYPEFEQAMLLQRPSLSGSAHGDQSDTAVLIISHPVFQETDFLGFVTISLPQESFVKEGPRDLDREPLYTVIFNDQGEIVSANGEVPGEAGFLPASTPLVELVDRPGAVFTAASSAGDQFTYAVAPEGSEVLNVLGVWDPDGELPSQIVFPFSPSFFPIMMWIASLVVAYFALNRLVVRQIRGLSGEIKSFAIDRRAPSTNGGRIQSGELATIERDFRRMAEDVIYDEAKLEGAIKEKDVLLKEVHHRVKNNLQLISSIMNMHLRKTTNPETKQILSRLQDRVQSLATVHRRLYQTEDLGELDVTQLVRDLVHQTARFSRRPDDDVDLSFDLRPVVMYPDQAVPLSLFVTEAAINAFKYVSAPEGEDPWVKVRFQDDGPEHVVFEISNSLDPASPPQAEGGEMSGFGSQLIKAFSMQLRARTEILPQEDSYVVRSRFAVQEFEPEYHESP
ncbi:sensor histidine kinase [Aestuariibius sp. 2305UL40-4]|uniref:sensor histidine kinase n=1 Tax=Aestuariibius violaceus TaxID=3234132 RepID=UPI00345E39A0